MVIVNKPSGLLVHKSSIDYHETRNLVDELNRRLNCRVHPVHRLDKPTSGIVVLALNADAAKALGHQFEQRQVRKTYVAVARGFTNLYGYIEYPVGDKDRPKKPKTAAVTLYKAIARLELPHRVDRYPTTRYTLLEINPLTGRRHQIRQHMKHINHPLIGDTSYGKTAHNKLFTRLYNSSRLLLHASAVSFVHPVSKQPLTINASPIGLTTEANPFQTVLADDRWQYIEDNTVSTPQ